MKLASTIQLYAGGVGSGCKGENCGRHGGGKGTDKTHVPKKATISKATKMRLAELRRQEMEYKQRGPYFRGELERVRAEIQRIREDRKNSQTKDAKGFKDLQRHVSESIRRGNIGGQ